MIRLQKAKLLLTRFTTFLRTTTTSKYYLYLLQLMMIRSRIKNPPCSSIEEWDGQFTAWGLKEKQSAMCKRDTTLEFSPTFLSHHPTLRLWHIHHLCLWLCSVLYTRGCDGSGWILDSEKSPQINKKWNWSHLKLVNVNFSQIIIFFRYLITY